MATLKDTFSKVIMVPGQAELAKVNRKTGVLYLSKEIWNQLPEGEKQFVLYHEAGHLKLESASEFKANEYAIKNYLNAGTFTNKELGAKIMVMRSALQKAVGAPQTSNFALTDVASGIVQSLSVLGVGSKSRIAETNATTNQNVAIITAQANASVLKSNANTKIFLVIGVFAVLGIVLFFTLKNRK